MLAPGTRVVLVARDDIVMSGELYVVFVYDNSYTLIGRDNDGDTAFGIYEAQCVEPYHAPQGPQLP